MPRYKSVHTGPQIDSGVERALPGGEIDLSLAKVARALPGGEIDQLRPNRNLLDNWYFQIWQRYSNGSYSGVPNGDCVLDRWIITSSNGDITSNLTKATPYGGIKNKTGPNCRITQRLENAAQFNGMTLTLSLLKNTGLYTATKVAKGWNDTTDIFGFFSSKVAWLNAGETILAAKLELGSVSTLANDPPADYGAELTRCKRYFNLWASEAARTAALLEVGAMRTTPVLYTIGIGGVTYYTAIADL